MLWKERGEIYDGMGKEPTLEDEMLTSLRRRGFYVLSRVFVLLSVTIITSGFTFIAFSFRGHDK